MSPQDKKLYIMIGLGVLGLGIAGWYWYRRSQAALVEGRASAEDAGVVIPFRRSS